MTPITHAHQNLLQHPASFERFERRTCPAVSTVCSVGLSMLLFDIYLAVYDDPRTLNGED